MSDRIAQGDVAGRRQALAGATLGNMVGLTPAVSAVFGLFVIPLAQTFGWKRAAISGVLGLISIGPALVAPFVGRLADRVGTRPILIGGNLCFAGAIALLALTTRNLLQFYATFALVACSAALVSTPVLAKVVSDWYDRNRGAALGFAAGMGNGLGSALLPAIAAATMAAAGWRAAYLAIAITVVAIGLPSYLLFVRDRARPTAEAFPGLREGMTLGAAARTGRFWLVVCAIAAGAGSLTAIFSHVAPILDERGVGIGGATIFLSVFALGTAACQMAGGAVLDRVATPRVIVPLYLAAVGGIVLLEWGHGFGARIVGALLLAIGLGTQFSALPYVLGRYFGVRHFGAIMGAGYSAVFVFQGMVPPLLDHFYDVQHSYAVALAAMASCLTVGGLCLLLLPPYRYGVEDAPLVVMHA